jgi:hypothetical protein
MMFSGKALPLFRSVSADRNQSSEEGFEKRKREQLSAQLEPPYELAPNAWGKFKPRRWLPRPQRLTRLASQRRSFLPLRRGAMELSKPTDTRSDEILKNLITFSSTFSSWAWIPKIR